MFKNIFRVMEMLRDLIEIGKTEKDLPANRTLSRTSSSHSLQRSPETPSMIAGKVVEFSRILFQYYYQYILKVVDEYGEVSEYRKRFSDDGEYLIEFHKLVTKAAPLLSGEKLELDLGLMDFNGNPTSPFPIIPTLASQEESYCLRTAGGKSASSSPSPLLHPKQPVVFKYILQVCM